ncbi:SNF2 family N-terminal domain-containing protein [Desarmillaria tabescens]|uniref:SNF2 family N-terminal domain-containing protein n=1 Tax=Armillaria tabescens TaxID=1929756 RepID=A0AA39NGF2_ARMTA|nr:SNF2 family N-terminal domain-containing protein [Desarmillaria tabescens]KAK0464993.1 SNF2 family N-terminal domain-containing protein [Desarmillaria tabescens]
MSLRSTPSLSNLTISNKSNPIDLTADDGDEIYDYPRQLKRMRLENITHPNNSSIPTTHSMPSTPSPTPSMSSFTIFTPSPNPPNNGPYRPPFAGPSSFHAPPPVAPSSIPQKRPSAHSVDRAIIDLTDSPSPPPQMQKPLPSPSLVELSPKTPVCIGQLTVTALVLYPIDYMMATNPASPQVEWGPVKLQYEHAPKPDGTTDNLNIKTPTGDPFGIVEHKVASSLGHMVGKGLIRLEAKVQKCRSNAPILPLTMLVYTPRGNVPVVGDYFYQCGLLLDHPTPPFSYNEIVSSKTPYMNPHNPPPGGHNRVQYAPNRSVYPPGANGRWSTATPAGKSVEVQRSQVDELFKNMKSGADLAEMEAAPEVATQLYPHQKKALTFLMEREREIKTPEGVFSSMWLARKSMSGHDTWTHIVTEKEVYEEPKESKGAILADDMGLGKTITCVSLIAATLNSALTFASTPLETPSLPWGSSSDDSPPAPSQFAGSVWNMPDVSENGPSSAKAKAKAQRAQEKLEAEHVRANRIKAKSRATLIICPLSTVSNWEDQFREHWNGEVQVFGGGAQREYETGKPLKVYIYHGNARRPDPAFLADFDAVITTYATLASEFSKQNRSIATAEVEEEEEGAGSSDGGGVEIDERGNQILRLPKTKKGGVKRKKPGLGASEASSALQSIHWFRVVLDEAHCIKETGTVGSRASCDLMADRRLCLTGTPVQNKLDDVFALIKFLRLQPLDDKAVWTEFIGTPVKFGQTMGIARLQTLMRTITLRRTKESKTMDGKRILSLPPRRDELRLLKFDAQEQEIYDQFFTASKAEFNEMSDKNEVMKNYVGILQKILRLRQICDHFELVEGKDLYEQDGTLSYEDIVAAIAKEGFTTSRAVAIFAILKESATTQCVECGSELCTSSGEGQDDAMDEMGPKKTKKNKASSKAPTRASSPSVPRPILTRCQHLFCLQCYRQCIHPAWPNVAPDIYRSCSACQTGLCPADAIEIKSEYLEGSSGKKKPARKEKRQRGTGAETCHPSTKIKALLGDLVQFSRTNPYSSNYDPDSIEVQMVDEKGVEVDEGVVKTVVFSQWTTMLDKIEEALESAAIRFDRLDGTMKRDERIRAMDALKYDPACEVLLVSLKAGGVGLNLTAAQRVYLMDPYWNPAVENQAVDRIHRLGQTRPVTTVKLIIENSIEARLLEVQKKKTELANMTLGSNFSKAELMTRRMEELNQLFGS